MKYVERIIEPLLRHTLERGKSIFFFGARQTFLEEIAPKKLGSLESVNKCQ